MPGFLITNTNEAPVLKNYDDSRCISNKLVFEEWTVMSNTLNKFLDDKLFFQNDEYIIVLDGVILNEIELIDKYNCTDFQSTFMKMMKNGEDFFSEFRGCFSGAIFDKNKKTWKVFTDHIGNKLVLYYTNDKDCIIGSQLNYIADCMKINGIEKVISEDWKNDIKYFGYVVDSHSMIENVKRIFPGDYMVFSENVIDTFDYYKVTKKNVNTDITIDEAIESIDKSFTNAVKRVINKANEYNYKIAVDISAGLDSRIISKVASNIDKDILLGINYSQSGSVDYNIPRKVMNQNCVDMIQYPMDLGNCLKDIDDLIFMNNGMNFYSGITGGKRSLERLDRGQFGLELWGILGEMCDGAMILSDDFSKLEWKYSKYRCNRRYNFHNDYGYSRNYEDNEIMWLYIRGIIAGQNTAFIRQNFIEAPAVFGDIEFLEAMYKVPYEMRTKDLIFKKWLIRYYPDMASIIYGSTGVTITDNPRLESIKRIPVRGKNFIKKFISKKYRNHMNPIDWWYDSNAELREYLENYYDNNKKYLEGFKDLELISEELYSGDTMIEKAVSLSIISAVKQYIV